MEKLSSVRLISNAGWSKLDFSERDLCNPFLLRLSLAGNLEKPLMPLYGTEWREHGNGLRPTAFSHWGGGDAKVYLSYVNLVFSIYRTWD